METIFLERQRAQGRRRGPSSGETVSSAPPGSDRPALSDLARHATHVSLDQLRRALTIRRTEERLLALFAEGQLHGTVHTCIGQEWIGIAVADALLPGDAIVTNHRGHGHYLARTDDVEGLVAELMGRSTGVCGGRGGSQHLCRDDFYANGIQGGMMPVAAGLALARRFTDHDHRLAAIFIGDGTFGEGVVYETLNLLARWSLPVLVVVEDNGISQSTHQSETLAGTIDGRARAFGLSVRHSDTWHPNALMEQAARAAHAVRESRQPAVLHVRTFRLKAHSKGDDPRDPREVARFLERDYLTRLIEDNQSSTREMLAAIDARLEQAVRLAEDAPGAEVPASNTSSENPGHAGTRSVRWQSVGFETTRVVDAINRALSHALACDPRVMLLGEDIRDPYGGAFKVTAGLSSAWPERVLNTPISEAGIVGVANGLALAGLRPIAEIMFSDFLLLAADQFVNHAAKFAGMYNDQVQVPMILRTPSGGYRGYGPTHSQCLEKHLLGVPGTRVLAVHRRYDPERLYRDLLASVDRPTLVVENKQLYGQKTTPEAPAGYRLEQTDALFPTVRLVPACGEADVTLVTYGGLADLTERAMRQLDDDEELRCELLLPTQLYPLDLAPIAESLRRSKRLVVIEEAQGFAGLGSEIIAALHDRADVGAFRATRVPPAECVIPASKNAETGVLPGIDRIIEAVVSLVVNNRSSTI